MPSVITVRSLIETACARLTRARLAYGHGIPTAWDEAAYFVLHALKLPPDRLTPYLEQAVTPRVVRKVMELVDARISRRVPAAYLTREAWLGEDRFYVDERVIVPRSFIAELIDERFVPWLPPRLRIRRALDLCTGSGCLAIVLAKTFRSATVDAVDIERGALAVARRNVADHKLQSRVRVLRSDMFDAVRGEHYDLIIANPPYVSADTMRKLPREYRHEPAIALASGQDGLDAVRVILREAAAVLTDKGLLVVEVGHHRPRVERPVARYTFGWPPTTGGGDCVFILCPADQLRAGAPAERPAALRTTAPRRASRAAAASRRK